MMSGVDKETGQTLSEDTIKYNVRKISFVSPMLRSNFVMFIAPYFPDCRLVNNSLSRIVFIPTFCSRARNNIRFVSVNTYFIDSTDGGVAGMLTFIMYYLLKNPEAMRKLREEVDVVIGDRPMTVDDVHKLPYLIGAPFYTLPPSIFYIACSCYA